MPSQKKTKLEVVEDKVAEIDDELDLPPKVDTGSKSGKADSDTEVAENSETKAETNGQVKVEMVKIPFRGQTFTIPKEMDEWDTEACLAMGDNNYALAAKLLLKQGQWALLQSLGNKRKDIREFLTAFGDVIDKECVG